MSQDQIDSSAAKGRKNGQFPALLGGAAVIVLSLSALVFMSPNGIAGSSEQTKTIAKTEPAAGSDKKDAAAMDKEKQAQADAPMLKMGDPVVAMIGDQEIKRSDVFEFISGLPEQVRQAPIQDIFPLALDQVINNRVIGEKSKAAQLDADPEVQKLIDQAKGQIVRNVFVERQINEQVNKKKLLKAYEDLLTKTADIQETHARHILVDTEEKAREAIKKLDGGAKFEDMVKEYATGPAAQNGGDLGYFAKEEMVPEFAEVAFSLEKGQYTKDPVKTQFGWHVIKAEDRRKRPEPEFEAVKPQLEAQMKQEILSGLLDQWQKDAKIKKFDINGEPVKSN